MPIAVYLNVVPDYHDLRSHRAVVFSSGPLPPSDLFSRGKPNPIITKTVLTISVGVKTGWGIAPGYC